MLHNVSFFFWVICRSVPSVGDCYRRPLLHLHEVLCPPGRFFFFFSWSVSCCLQWKWHSDACLSPTALAALAWFKMLTAQSTRGSNSTLIKIFFLFFFFESLWAQHHPHETVKRCSLKRNNLVDTELKEGDLHWTLTSDFYTMIRLSKQPPPTITATKKRKKSIFRHLSCIKIKKIKSSKPHGCKWGVSFQNIMRFTVQVSLNVARLKLPKSFKTLEEFVFDKWLLFWNETLSDVSLCCKSSILLSVLYW